MEIKLAYALKDGKVVHISEIQPENRGLRCSCFCPFCNRPLLAKIGDIRIPHFAHANNWSDCNILHAQQLGLHLLAKDIIKKNSSILLPAWNITRKDIVPNNIQNEKIVSQIKIEEKTYPARFFSYSSAVSEKRINKIIPDIIVYINNNPCAIEIAVTHFVDEDKRAKVKSMDLPMFEIDLSDLVKKNVSKEEIDKAVLYSSTNRKWIYNPKKAKLLNENRRSFKEEYTQKVYKEEQEKAKLLKEKECAISSLRKALVPTTYRKEIIKLRNEKQAIRCLKYFSFSKELTKYPFYMDIPISGEFVFSCDRRIWQGKLFDDYVYSGFGRDLINFNVPAIVDKIKKGRMFIQFDKQKIFPSTAFIFGAETEIDLPNDVIKKYFEYLFLLGFISSFEYNTGSSKRPKSLNPPDTIAANVLEEIIKTIDPYDPNIDKTIFELLSQKLPKDYLCQMHGNIRNAHFVPPYKRQNEKQ